ncbi:intradiol ring-cleavage dioxygenase [Christiangramia sediminis]|uniref:Intradiol ring-cleavage dioxygenase n=1 Tax=Christiangramia sediminis TaxID=2881336 RepID=A0A9X1LJZ3_9FLAO|nr:intradiol ring-cleavage dioxygenase [Christiangramia sediminis]MCB7481647.1 intradiol ring-cleavage dioxygenase [Christiangramia sediminis]
MDLRIIIFGISLLLFSCARSQQQLAPILVGGPCEGCEAVLEYGKRDLNAVDTLPEFASAENKLKITGTIYEADGSTPAEDIVLYIHHTNADGVYPTKGDEKDWAKRHGYLRGWIKTGKDGEFTFYTQVPAGYPDRRTPAHIHPYILEPDGSYYYLSAYFFEDDPRFTKDHMEDPPRGSKGVVQLTKTGKMALIERDFVLGQGIPGYK